MELATDDAAFLAAICASPDDDAQRLVYADHLLESADEWDRTRGEFIVAQCRAASLPRTSEAWRRAKDRERALWPAATHRPKGQLWSAFDWKGGFPSGVACVPALLRKVEKELASLPFDRLALHASRRHTAAATLGDLAWASNRLPHVRGLLIANHRSSGTLDPRRLGQLENEREKTVAWSAEAMPDPSLRDAVTVLSVDFDIAPFLKEPLPALEELALRAFEPREMLAMSDRPLRKLTWHAVNDACTASPCGLSTFDALEELDASIRLDAPLASAIRRSNLRRVSLRHDATDDGLASFEPPRGLRHLALMFSGGGWHADVVEAARYRLPAIDAPELESLHLGRFIIDDSFGSVTLPKLAELELTECILEPKGVDALLKLEGLYRPLFLRCVMSVQSTTALRARWPDVRVE